MRIKVTVTNVGAFSAKQFGEFCENVHKHAIDQFLHEANISGRYATGKAEAVWLIENVKEID